MPNHKIHKFFGLLVWLLLIVFSLVFLDPAEASIELVILAGLPVCLLGSVLPDIDHKNSRVFKKLRIVVFIVAFLASFGFLYENRPFAEAVGVSCVVAIVFFVSLHVLMPRHRGIIHSIKVAVIYAVLVFALAMFLFDSIEAVAMLTVFGFMSYFSHLVLDKI